MSRPLISAIKRTICYSDIFDYPLTSSEISKWLIKSKIKNKNIKTTIKNEEIIREKKGFYFLKGREEIVEIRKKRKKFSGQKMIIAEKIARLLKIVPTIKLVGITGALALDNAKENDDVDLLIVTSRKLLWTTRFLVTILVELLGKRRRPNDTYVNNKICLNMFLDEDHLKVGEKDLFSAHEILQMKLLWDRDNTYGKFLSENIWINKYLPNAIEDIQLSRNQANKKSNSTLFNSFIVKLLNVAEIFFKKFQLWYMRNHRTTEKISDGIIRFHPCDSRSFVMEEYSRKIRKYNI